jgi:hypothetical protein
MRSPGLVATVEARRRYANAQARLDGRCPCGRPALYVSYRMPTVGTVAIEVWRCSWCRYPSTRRIGWIGDPAPGTTEPVLAVPDV